MLGTCASHVRERRTTGYATAACAGAAGAPPGREYTTAPLGRSARGDADATTRFVQACAPPPGELCDALHAREYSVYVRGLAWKVGETVWVKWTATGEQYAGKVWRWTTGVIKELLSGGEVRVSWPADEADDVLTAWAPEAWQTLRKMKLGDQVWLHHTKPHGGPQQSSPRVASKARLCTRQHTTDLRSAPQGAGPWPRVPGRAPAIPTRGCCAPLGAARPCGGAGRCRGSDT